MSSSLRNVTFDSADPWKLARFWSEVTGWRIHPESEEHEVLVESPDSGPGLLFVVVPETKSIKNRVHFDVEPSDRTREEEVQRLLGIGATVASDMRNPDGTGWVTMADPEGNEFCVERSAGERGR